MSTTFTLPKALAETYAEIARRDGRPQADGIRIALEIYAARATLGDAATENGIQPPTPSPEFTGPVDDGRTWSERRTESYASLGIDASKLPARLGSVESGPDDGYDSTNIKDWIRATWKPE